MPVHIFGLPCRIDEINAIAARHGIPVVEDAAEALGARRQGRAVGTHGNPAVFAFYPNKQITTGEGGMVTTDDDDVAASLHSLANQGRADAGNWLEHDRLGWNYRMSDVAAAIGLGQVERLDEILASRAAVAARYAALLAGVDGVTPPAEVEGDTRSWFVYPVLVAEGVDRDRVLELLWAEGVQAKPYLPAIHLQPFYRSRGHREGELPVCEAISRRSLAVPFYAAITPDDQERVVQSLSRAVERAAG